MQTLLFRRPIETLVHQTRIKEGVVDIYAIAWDGYDHKVVALLYGGRKTHVNAAWAAIMSNNEDVGFYLSGHGYVWLRKLAGKGLYMSRDFLLPCGASVKFTFLRQMTREGVRMLKDEPEFYYLASHGDENVEALRFAQFVQSATLIALKPNVAGTGVDLQWAHDLYDVGRRMRLVSHLSSEGMTAYKVSRDGKSWRDAIEWGIKRSMFPMNGEGF
jgi:hypothetical protein